MTKPNADEEATSGYGCYCASLRRATRRISQMYDEVLSPTGLKTSQRAILAEISRAAPTNVGALAKKLVMDPGALAHTLRPLDREGFVTIAVDPKDKRVRLISLTRKGKAKLAATNALWLQAQEGFQVAFGKSEAKSLQRFMQMITSDQFADDFETKIGVAQRDHVN